MAQNSSSGNPHPLFEPLRKLHYQVRADVVDACERSALEAMAAVAREEEGDTIYAVDRVSEELLIEFISREVATHDVVVLVAEGLPAGKVTLPHGANEQDARWCIVVDPIDGTRGLMYQKRSAWILTGVAPYRGPQTSLADIEFAMQTEIPILKQYLSDGAWAIKGAGAHAERFNRLTNESMSIKLTPSKSESIEHGYAEVSRFFPGARDELAAIDEEIVLGALGPAKHGKAHCFEDQYASSGGQLYELMCGHDRFIADLRPLLQSLMESRGMPLGICCHPYDVCTELIAREAGVIVTDTNGEQLNCLLSVEPDVAWLGYANEKIRQQIEPHLRTALERRGLKQLT